MKKPTLLTVLLAAGVLAGCTSAPKQSGGRYYADDGPLQGVTQEQVDAIPEPIPRREPLASGPKKPYQVMGKSYIPMTTLSPYREEGIASWYGTKYHGRRTANGEIYDLLALTAAHPILPLPSYVRVTNLDNGKSLVVRVNDRGPFLHGRVIDLSFAAAMRLGFADKGSARVSVELIIP